MTAQNTADGGIVNLDARAVAASVLGRNPSWPQ